MNVLDLHPEELLDRDARGELDATGRARLDAHLATCAACRFERVARHDFAGELADAGEPKVTLGLVAQGGAATTPGSPPRVARPGRGVSLLLVAAALLTTGVVAAAGAVAVYRMATERTSTAAPTSGADAGASQSSARPHRSRGNAAPAASPVDSEEIHEAPTAAQPAPTEVGAPLPVPAATVVSSPISTPTPTTRAVQAVPGQPAVARGSEHEASKLDAASGTADEPATAPRPELRVAAATLFERANEARRRGDVDGALALYRELEQRYPHSDEASVASAIVGRVLLEHGEASRALERFDSYLDRSGPLGEEAMIGRARALGRLGRAREEAAAWRALLREFPGSAHADEARARIDTLGRGGPSE